MSLKSTIKDIKDAGFGYIKVELEANLNRPYDDDCEYETCYDCDGRGYQPCDECDGDGYIEEPAYSQSGRDLNQTVEVECEECDGSGEITCSPCDGDGEVYAERDDDGFGSVDYCEEYIVAQLSEQAKEALNYKRFYNDGSVDSEFTFTIPVDAAKLLPEYIKAFSKLAEANGEGMDVDGAGMHIAVLPTESRGYYPAEAFMDNEKLQNFTTEVTKLLPALFIAACSGNFTRALNYRHPKIENDKYSAIHVVGSGRCLEYRLFETCYQRPEAIFEYLGTIARTLEYYKDPSKKVEAQGKEFVFYDNEGVEGFTSTPDQVRIIKKQLNLITPKGMTLKEFQSRREITLSVQQATKGYAGRVSKARAMFREHLKDYDTRIKRPLNDYERREIREREEYGDFSPSMSMEEKVAYIRGLNKPEEQQFIRNNVFGGFRRAETLAV